MKKTRGTGRTKWRQKNKSWGVVPIITPITSQVHDKEEESR